MNWPSTIPDIQIASGGAICSIQYEEMHGCLPQVGFASERAVYKYPEGCLTEVCRYEVICLLRYASMEVYEVAELPKSSEGLPDLWYFGLSDKGVHCLRYVTRYRDKIGKIEEYSEQHEPHQLRIMTVGYQRDYEWSESWGAGEDASYRCVDRVGGPFLVSIAGTRFECLTFENMVLTMDSRPIELNVHFVCEHGRTILYRRWQGEADGRYEGLADCPAMEYRRFTWRQNYDMVADVAIGGEVKD